MGRKVTLKAGWSFWAKAVANTLNAKPIGKLVMNLVESVNLYLNYTISLKAGRNVFIITMTCGISNICQHLNGII